ncbi:MAG TPA: hypothetical protein PLH36_11270, partial [Armatimonadota bacterium]|nr:hypothetical protein [Armatimonadota bacterium]
MGGLWLFLGPMLAVGAMLAAGYGIAAPGTAGPVPARPPRPFPWDIVIAITAMILFVAFLA